MKITKRPRLPDSDSQLLLIRVAWLRAFITNTISRHRDFSVRGALQANFHGEL